MTELVDLIREAHRAAECLGTLDAVMQIADHGLAGNERFERLREPRTDAQSAFFDVAAQFLCTLGAVL